MNIYTELKKDHDHLKALIEKLSVASSAPSRRELIAEIRDLLVPHSRAEELVLYNVLRDFAEAKDIVSHSYQEHVKAETILRGLQVTESVALNWKSGVQKLKEELDHHVTSEEGRMFQAAKRVISDEEAKELGLTFNEVKPKLGAGFVMSQIELLANMMPSRFRSAFIDYVKQSETNRRAS